MVWFVQPQQIANKDGSPSGRWRMTCTSDEGGGGPFGDMSHDHSSAEEAQECEQCDEFCARSTGFPSKKQKAEQAERRNQAEYERLHEALTFYRDAWYFSTSKKFGGLEWKPKEELLDDCGNRARAVLADMEGRKSP